MTIYNNEKEYELDQIRQGIEKGLVKLPQGPIGPQGEKGDRGERGQEGKPGKEGKSGPRGKDGRNGKDGKDGKPGRDGKDGKQGPKGERGPKGDKGDTGPRGPQGPSGRDGTTTIINKTVGGGSSALQITEDGSNRKQGVSKINFGSGFDVASTPNGVDITLDADENPLTLTLQNVTDNGSTTTNNITANSYIKTGGTSDDVLLGDGSTTSLAGIATPPAGNDTEIQFNNSGSFGADSNFRYENDNLLVGTFSATPTGTGNIILGTEALLDYDLNNQRLIKATGATPDFFYDAADFGTRPTVNVGEKYYFFRGPNDFDVYTVDTVSNYDWLGFVLGVEITWVESDTLQDADYIQLSTNIQNVSADLDYTNSIVGGLANDLNTNISDSFVLGDQNADTSSAANKVFIFGDSNNTIGGVTIGDSNDNDGGYIIGNSNDNSRAVSQDETFFIGTSNSDLTTSGGATHIGIGSNIDITGTASGRKIGIGGGITMAGEGVMVGTSDMNLESQVGYALGRNITVSGNFGTALGYSLEPRSFGESTVGFRGLDTITPFSTTAYDGRDNIFRVGSGISITGTRRDAMQIRKDGTVTFNGLTGGTNDAFAGITMNDTAGSPAFTVDADGDTTAKSFIKSSATSDDVLLGDGTTTSLANLDVGGSDGDLQINDSGAFGTIDGLNLDKTGDARGTDALDIQTDRSATTQVASGTRAITMGYRNTASGPDNIAIGSNNSALGQFLTFQGDSFLIGSNNSSTAGAYSTYGFGKNVAFTGSGSVGFGGTLNLGGSSYSFGLNNTVSGGALSLGANANIDNVANAINIGLGSDINNTSGTERDVVQIGIGLTTDDSDLVEIGDSNTTKIQFKDGHVKTLRDNSKYYMGVADDASVYYDGTDMILDPDEVGTGKVLIGSTGDDDIQANSFVKTGGTSSQFLKADGSVDSSTYLTDIVSDTTPQLGGNLDAQSNDITAVGKLDYDYAVGNVSALGNLGATEAIDWSTATHFTGTLDSDVTITHSNEVSGQKITLALAYDGTAQRTITWSDVDKWAGGTAPTAPSASGEELLVTLLYLGTTCYGSYETFS